MDLKETVSKVLSSWTAKKVLDNGFEFSLRLNGGQSSNDCSSDSVFAQKQIRDELREFNNRFGAWERMENVLQVWFAAAFTGLLILAAWVVFK